MCHLRLQKGDAQLGVSFRIYGRKVFSVALIFNSLLTISCAIGLLHGVYADHWKPYLPYLVDGNLLWLMTAAAVLNIFPAAYTGKVHTGRLWFHHYVYGFIVLLSSSAWVTLFTSISLLNLFRLNTANVAVNVGRFFVLGGLTLIIDDLPDTSKTAKRSIVWLKLKAYQARKILHVVQCLMGFTSLYLLLAISLSIMQSPQWVTAANFILIGTLTVTTLTSFGSVKRKIWLRLQT
jgi:hypothetical protein